jgi:hypothetical protein
MKLVCLAFAVLTILVSVGCKSAPSPQSQTPAPSPSAENYPNLAARAKELGDALGRKDYAKVIDLTYAKVVELGGGREKLLAAMTNEMKTMETEGVELLSSTSGAPSQILHDAGGIYAVVPVVSKLKAKDGVFQTEGSLIAISTDAGQNWTFVDATGKDQTELKKILPNLDKLKLPPEKEPVKVAS